MSYRLALPFACLIHFLLTHVKDVYCFNSLTKMCGASLNKGCWNFRSHCWQKDICPKVYWEMMFFLLFPLWTFRHCAILDSSLFPSSCVLFFFFFFFYNIYIHPHNNLIFIWLNYYWRKQANDERSERTDNAERGRKNRRRKMSPAYNGGSPKSLSFSQQAILDQSINAAVKVFTSTEGKSFQNWFVITDVSLCVCSAWL